LLLASQVDTVKVDVKAEAARLQRLEESRALHPGCDET